MSSWLAVSLSITYRGSTLTILVSCLAYIFVGYIGPVLITYLGYIVAIIIWVNSSYTSDRSLVKHNGEKMYYIWDEFPGQCLQLWLLSCVLMLLCLCASLIDRASSDRALGGLGALRLGLLWLGFQWLCPVCLASLACLVCLACLACFDSFASLPCLLCFARLACFACFARLSCLAWLASLACLACWACFACLGS